MYANRTSGLRPRRALLHAPSSQPCPGPPCRRGPFSRAASATGKRPSGLKAFDACGQIVEAGVDASSSPHLKGVRPRIGSHRTRPGRGQHKLSPQCRTGRPDYRAPNATVLLSVPEPTLGLDYLTCATATAVPGTVSRFESRGRTLRRRRWAISAAALLRDLGSHLGTRPATVRPVARVFAQLHYSAEHPTSITGFLSRDPCQRGDLAPLGQRPANCQARVFAEWQRGLLTVDGLDGRRGADGRKSPTTEGEHWGAEEHRRWAGSNTRRTRTGASEKGCCRSSITQLQPLCNGTDLYRWTPMMRWKPPVYWTPHA